ncbi:DUF2867 domain-containing protein [Deinococcus peraridilitoris]|uniref:DUF2867 domain-containing protein n=1 Tax=Deinococcus peraridilitoris (strain DSM 19664 / LMG 22246 / CIP 109416 / KR-200) TaxID=937777 RepID=L0A1I0_DEIPD|nr:DUF2867 domain-containing protein [Deinococcus peraridilitoris]AFZ67753.1 Protein of unknown function (DUF2867) [Deinococcus peraridilitoris DSM 19664]
MTYPRALQDAIRTASYVEEKQVRSTSNLPDFLASLLGYAPPWLRALYRVRVVFLGVLGHRTTGIPDFTRAPRLVPMQSGERVSFFEVEAAHADLYWVAVAREAHLSARLAVLREPATHDEAVFRVITVVHLHNAVGRVYFTTILPFHHLVISAMMRFAANRRVRS